MQRLTPRWPIGVAPIAVIMIMVFATFAVASKTAWELGPEWCARYTVVKFMLNMEEGLCPIEPSTGANPTLSGKVAVRHIEPF